MPLRGIPWVREADMLYLNAALAFAVTMLIMAIVTSTVVETIHRIIGLREDGLQRMMGHLYDRVLVPLFKTKDETFKSTPEHRRSFIDLMTVNRAPSNSDDSQTENAADMDAKHGFLSRWLWDGRRISELTAEDFMSRLATSDYEKLLPLAGSNPDPVLQDVEFKFGQFGVEATTYFGRRARLLSVVGAIAVAFAFHVHPANLWSSYTADPDTAQSVIALYDEAVKRSKESDDAEANKEIVDAIKIAKKNIVRQVDQLSGAGLTLGWPGGTFDLNAGEPAIAKIFWLIFGGILIGLGAPFWTDAFKSLMSVRNMLSTSGADQTQGPATPKTAAQRAFELAQKAKQPKPKTKSKKRV
jgi:hypothetical protein